jgi:hypothetical protein
MTEIRSMPLGAPLGDVDFARVAPPWRALPVELCQAILLHLLLPQLRLLKTVSRAMANSCRAVLRSEAWQKIALNQIALEAELKTQLHAYKLPLTVSIFSAFFPEDAPCIATVHRLKLARVNCNEVACDTSPEAWKFVPADDDDTFTSITDMCIEVHGVGICGSETSLRITLQEEMRRRGTPKPTGFKVNTADALWPYKIEPEEDGWSIVHGNEWVNEVKLDRLLDRMEIVTEVRKGVWWMHEPPHSGQNGFEHCGELSLLGLCRLGSKLLL